MRLYSTSSRLARVRHSGRFSTNTMVGKYTCPVQASSITETPRPRAKELITKRRELTPSRISDLDHPRRRSGSFRVMSSSRPWRALR